jgi:hypothetical protein
MVLPWPCSVTFAECGRKATSRLGPLQGLECCADSRPACTATYRRVRHYGRSRAVTVDFAIAPNGRVALTPASQVLWKRNQNYGLETIARKVDANIRAYLLR